MKISRKSRLPRRVLLRVALAAILNTSLLMGATPAAGAEAAPPPSTKKDAVKGARERRAARFLRLVKSFRGDRKVVYERYGFPSSRTRERGADGAVSETWTYVNPEREFVFAGDVLVRAKGR